MLGSFILIYVITPGLAISYLVYYRAFQSSVERERERERKRGFSYTQPAGLMGRNAMFISECHKYIDEDCDDDILSKCCNKHEATCLWRGCHMRRCMANDYHQKDDGSLAVHDECHFKHSSQT